jgi:hypothetical protein
MDQLLEGPIPPETESDCRDCPLCAENSDRNKSEYVFNSWTKCCTYMPDLPNYLAGRILQDQDPLHRDGRRAFEAQLSRNLILTPLGAYPPPSYRAAYTGNTEGFGQNLSLRCPYFLEEGGLCGIWKHRNSRCATWFCKFKRGSVGVIFWKYMDQLLSAVERSLSSWCVLQLNIGAAALEQLFPPPPTPRVLADLPKIWGDWSDKEIEFYKECSRLVERLTWQDVSLIGGAEINVFARLARQAYENLLSKTIGTSLKVGNWKKIIPANGETYRIWSYSPYDPLDLPRFVVDVLHYFDGRPTQEVLEIIFKEKGIKMDRNDLQKLTDFGILVRS